MKQETFIHRFSDTVQCEITITADPPPKGKSRVRNVWMEGRQKIGYVARLQ
jgi:hypothetical protein